MLLTNRRHRLIFLSLAGMDCAVALPYLAVLAGVWAESGSPTALRGLGLLSGQPLAAFAVLWALLLVEMLAADLINRWGWPSPFRELAVLVLLVITWLAAVRGLLYPHLPAGDWRWLGASLAAVFNFTAGFRGELLLLLASFGIWTRVARYTDRDLSFFGVGVSFRLGLLLALLGNSLLVSWAGRPQETAIRYFVTFFAFGLAAVSLARVDQKAVGAAQSSGALLPWPRFGQLWLAIAATLGIALTAAAVYTPATLRGLLRYLGPVGSVLEWLLLQVVMLLFLVLGPLIEMLAGYLRTLVGDPVPPPLQEPAYGAPYTPLGEIVRQWPSLRYCLVGGTIVLALLLLMLFFVRTQLRLRRDEREELAPEEMGLQTGRLDLGLDRLRAWFNLLMRYGAGRALLDAISVENIYANLGRLARRRGFGRPAAQSPDAYLPTLEQAFPDHSARLARITAAYLRVHYGEHPISAAELAELRTDYAAITLPPEAK